MRALVNFVACLALLHCWASAELSSAAEEKIFRAGAAEVDVTPPKFPVIVNGMFEERTATGVVDPVMSRAIVLDDGQEKIAIVVVDNLMIPRDLLDEAKDLASKATGIRTDRILISATHTHSAPSAMGCLGSRADVAYQQFLPPQIAKSIVIAHQRLVPARIGWSVVQDPDHNHTRRWIFRPDRMPADPFGVHNVRAHMHPGYQSPNHIGPSGPEDQDLTIVSLQTRDGKPLALLGNYAMHYFGSPLISSDICGRFGGRVAKFLGAEQSDPPFVGILSQGTSGDSMWMDYSKPASRITLDEYADQIAKFVEKGLRDIQYHDYVPIAMAEGKLTLRRRVPSEERLAWSKKTLESHGDKPFNNLPAIYAREQIYIHETPEVELKLQAIRLGDLAICTLPNEVYGITGWKLKSQSPLGTTFNIELANGAEGYIPPPEQHDLGGYTTWAARTAGLEVDAEPKIVAKLLELLEKVTGKPPRKLVDAPSPYSEKVLADNPRSFWRMGEIEGRVAHDITGKASAKYEPGVAYYLTGEVAPGLTSGIRGNRAVHFAGGRLHASVASLGQKYTIEGWIWNGLPSDARPVTGYFYSRGPNGNKEALGEHLGIGGTYQPDWAGKLLVFNGNARNEALVGKSTLAIRTWYHVALVRDGNHVSVYLNGAPEPDLHGELASTVPSDCDDFFLGGRSDNLFNWEGKLDEFSLFDRALSPEQITAHYKAASRPTPVAATIPPVDPPPMSPAESLRAMRLRPGYEADLVAHEPLVLDPVAIDWGPDGRLWIAEMADYPLGIDGQGKPGGRIRVLEDTNADGQYDKATVFAEGLNFPTGVLAWEKGVLVTAAPNILYLEDTSGDGKADINRPLFTGFLEGNQQLRVNGLRVGLDNWVYCASGSHHGGYGAASKIKSALTGDEIYIGSRDFRFQPNTGRIEPLSGPSQYGRNRDDWGHWFGVQNSHPIWHYVLEDRYSRRNPYVIPPDPKRQLLPANPQVFSAKPPEKRFHNFQESGRFTSACSAMIYRDDLLFSGEHAFTCEPFHNLVQHNVLTPEGVSFHAARDPAEADREFLASEDRWCRPVMAITGPDGALWIVDMYRFMIEHPEWLPPAGKEELRPYYREGDDKGRIYRIYPTGKKPAGIVRLDKLSPAELVGKLSSTNGWQRDMAQRLLIAKKDLSVVPLLEKMAASESPRGRLHAIWTLSALEQLKPEVLSARLSDSHPEIRRNALLLTEGRKDAALLLPTVLSLVKDPEARVRLQLACTLGEFTTPEVGKALAQLAIDNQADPDISGAVASSVSAKNVGDVLNAILGRSSEGSTQLQARYLSLATQLSADEAVTQALKRVVEDFHSKPAAWQFIAIAGMQDALRRRSPADKTALSGWKSTIEQLQSAARSIVADAQAEESLRVAAVAVLGRDPGAQQASDWQLFQSLLTPQAPTSLQSAIIAQWSQESSPEIATSLLQGWKSHSPPLRSQILTVIASRPAWIERLLQQLDKQSVNAGEIDAPLRAQLVAIKDEALRNRLVAIFAKTASSDRKQVLADYQASAQLPGDAARGAVFFQKKCATCHKLGDVGQEVGPSLAALSNKSPPALLVSILDPSSAVDSKYLSYITVTVDGRSLSGILATETGVSVTLLAADGKRYDILRSDIETLQSTGKSLMPDGLEKDLSPQDLADLIAFVAQAKPASPPK
ncbi:MAG: PVC-type heme-binding CxxCH protein [Planctomycetaceae bacterium]